MLKKKHLNLMLYHFGKLNTINMKKLILLLFIPLVSFSQEDMPMI